MIFELDEYKCKRIKTLILNYVKLVQKQQFRLNID